MDDPISITYQRSKLAVLYHLNRSEEDLNDAVMSIKYWIESQPHLPRNTNKNRIEFFLLNNTLDIEAAKKKLESYYTMRTSLTIVFQYSNPGTPQMKSTIGSTQIVPLPKLLENIYSVMLIKLRKYVPAELDPHWWVAAAINAHEINIQENLMLNYVLIYDLENLTLEHVLKLTPMFILNCSKMADKGLGRPFKGIHFINCPPVFQLALTIIRNLLRPDLYALLHIHSSLDSLRETFPIDILPKDYGGNEKYVNELEETWLKKYDDYKDYFDNLDVLKVNKDLRPNISLNLFGFLPFDFRNMSFD
ncbi:retinol-binding protein pinta-like [Diorhabda carinulata]|uniref:retinol-binding protein pinta-like n=1 Tax=Diorhabda carinulata TaxID=1163345 RepID=UPI0025A23EBD|nr:retinol-binding protein pinta-like [Diorhabda carinulata]